MKTYKRVLVLSHNAFSNKQNNGKTLEAFFKEWDKNSIAQIYLQPEVPDFEFCSNYFRLTDYEVLNNILSRGNIGKVIRNEQNIKPKQKFNPLINKLYEDRRGGGERKGLNKFIHKSFVARVPIFSSTREIMWKLSRWKTKHLVDWINDFSPDVLFFQGSSGVFGYRIALWICSEFNIPLVLELTDDYTLGLYPYSLIEKINKIAYKRIFKKAITHSKKVITISDEMAKEYKTLFGGTYTTLMNTVERKHTISEPQGFRFLYAGNVSLNRWKVLKKVGIALDKINKKKSTNYYFDIYTPAGVPQEIISEFQDILSVKFRGTLNQKELAEQVQKSNVLVHVESFDRRMKKITRLSVSTKIPEYMASKRCILAVGPDEVASVKYLSDNDYAVVVNSDNVDEIENKIFSIIDNYEYKNQIISNAYEGYLLKHHPDIVQRTIYEVIEDACRV